MNNNTLTYLIGRTENINWQIEHNRYEKQFRIMANYIDIDHTIPLSHAPNWGDAIRQLNDVLYQGFQKRGYIFTGRHYLRQLPYGGFVIDEL